MARPRIKSISVFTSNPENVFSYSVGGITFIECKMKKITSITEDSGTIYINSEKGVISSFSGSGFAYKIDYEQQ